MKTRALAGSGQWELLWQFSHVVLSSHDKPPNSTSISTSTSNSTQKDSKAAKQLQLTLRILEPFASACQSSRFGSAVFLGQHKAEAERYTLLPEADIAFHSCVHSHSRNNLRTGCMYGNAYVTKSSTSTATPNATAAASEFEAAAAVATLLRLFERTSLPFAKQYIWGLLEELRRGREQARAVGRTIVQNIEAF